MPPSAHAIQVLSYNSAMSRAYLCAVRSAQKPLTELLHRLNRIEADSAFPHHSHTPSFRLKGKNRRSVALSVRFQFGVPELTSSLWKSKEWAIKVPVPEASMHEYDRLPFGEYEVRLAGKPSRMKSEAESSCPEHPTYNHLRLRVLGPDSRHQC